MLKHSFKSLSGPRRLPLGNLFASPTSVEEEDKECCFHFTHCLSNTSADLSLYFTFCTRSLSSLHTNLLYLPHILQQVFISVLFWLSTMLCLHFFSDTIKRNKYPWLFSSVVNQQKPCGFNHVWIYNLFLPPGHSLVGQWVSIVAYAFTFAVKLHQQTVVLVMVQVPCQIR